MRRLLMCCAVLAGLAAAGWTSTADAHWGRGGVSISVGRPAYYGGYRGGYGGGYGWGYAPRYYGGHYHSYPSYGGYYGGGYYGGGYYGGGYYGGCGW